MTLSVLLNLKTMIEEINTNYSIIVGASITM